MAAEGSVGPGSGLISFPIARFGSETFLTCPGIPYDIIIFRVWAVHLDVTWV